MLHIYYNILYSVLRKIPNTTKWGGIGFQIHPNILLHFRPTQNIVARSGAIAQNCYFK